MAGKTCILTVLLAVSASLAFGQQEKAPEHLASSEPGFPQQDYAPDPKDAKEIKLTYQSRTTAKAHKAELDKQREKFLKYGDNPQFAERDYFGHKRYPKKRSIKRMKQCKVCGIRH